MANASERVYASFKDEEASPYQRQSDNNNRRNKDFALWLKGSNVAT